MKKIYKYIGASALTLGMLLPLSQHTLASNLSKKSNVDVGAKVSGIETTNSITLNWKLKGEKFKVYRDQDLIWEGSDSVFKDTDLVSDQLYSYRIGVYDENNNLTEISNLKTSTKKAISEKSSFSENSPVEHELESNVGLNYVYLSWSNLEDSDGIYEVYRDQELIGTTNNSFYEDTSVESGTSYTYEIIAKTEVSDEKKLEIKKTINDKGLTLSEQEMQNLFEQQTSLIRVIQTNENNSEKELLSTDLPEFVENKNGEIFGEEEEKSDSEIDTLAVVSKPTYLFRYTTFIPEKTVSDLLSPGNYLHGDNRGYDAFSSKYRTRSDVYAGWLGGTTLDHDPSVGKSIRYSDKAGTNVIKSATASKSNIKISKDSQTTKKITWRINHDVGVPFAAIYPNITYYYEGTQNSTGTMKVKGAHDKAPNHEFYWGVAYTDATPKTIFKHTGGSYFNLVPGSPQTFFEISM